MTLGEVLAGQRLSFSNEQRERWLALMEHARRLAIASLGAEPNARDLFDAEFDKTDAEIELLLTEIRRVAS
jgi:hypothetical protein